MSILLIPFSWIYSGLTKLRLYLGAHQKIDIPVICVGNINMGGTGKTPVVIDLVMRLLEMGKKPIVVTRGYGGSNKGPIMVTSKHTADDVGDEPILLTGFSEVCVSRNRIYGAKMALSHGADVIILDDGLQNPDLLYDLTITVMDQKVGFGNSRVFIISIGDKALTSIRNVPCLNGYLKPLETGMDWNGLRSFAFAGIGRPEKFFSTLRTLGAEIVATREFGDHQKIPVSILKRLEAEASLKNSQLVTTEKDAARLPKEWQQKVLTLPVRLSLNDEKKLNSLLNKLF